MNSTRFLAVLRTKTGWAGVVAILTGLHEGIFLGDWSAGMNKIIIGVGLLTGRHAIAKGG